MWSPFSLLTGYLYPFFLFLINVEVCNFHQSFPRTKLCFHWYSLLYICFILHSSSFPYSFFPLVFFILLCFFWLKINICSVFSLSSSLIYAFKVIYFRICEFTSFSSSGKCLAVISSSITTVPFLFFFLDSNYSWPLNDKGLNCAGPLRYEYFSIVHTAVLHSPWLVDSTDMELPRIQRGDYKLYTD